MPSDALDYITIKGFKSIASIEKLPLTPVNIIIGPNGSGKSNLIGAFAFLHEIREGRLQDYVTRSGGAEKVLHFGSKTTPRITFSLSFSEEVNQYSLVLAPGGADTLYPFAETASFWDKRFPTPVTNSLQPLQHRLEAGISASHLTAVTGWLRSRLDGWRVYHVHDTSPSSPIRKTARVDDNRVLRTDGANLAAYLYLLQEQHPESYALIRSVVRRVAPFFEDFRLEPLKLRPDDIKLEWRHRNSDQYFDASSLSDGTLRFMALATLLLQPHDLLPSVILVDEPELGLHPYAIGLLASLIRQASSHAQVIVSTQSSLLLDHFEPADILVAERVDGATAITRPDADRLAAWLQDYSLGQLWEKNELGGRPAGD